MQISVLQPTNKQFENGCRCQGRAAYGLGDDLSYVIVLLVTVAAFQYS